MIGNVIIPVLFFPVELISIEKNDVLGYSRQGIKM